MPWWGWMVVGMLLLGAELLVVDAEFFLVFIGLSAALIGLADLMGIHMPVWAQYLSFAALSVLSMVLFRRKVYTMVRGNPPSLEDALTGETIQLTEDLPPGATSRVEFRGTTWNVANKGNDVIRAGTRVTIDDVDGTTLNIS